MLTNSSDALLTTECCICMFENMPHVQIVPCGHRVCATCVHKCMLWDVRCPVCRRVCCGLSGTYAYNRKIKLNGSNHAGITLENSKNHVKVTSVNSNDEAYKNGLRSGDELVAINGFECRCHKKVCSIIDQASRDGICLHMSVKRGPRRHKYWNVFTGFIRLPWRKHPRPN